MLNAGRFAGLGVGRCPETAHGFLWHACPETPHRWRKLKSGRHWYSSHHNVDVSAYAFTVNRKAGASSWVTPLARRSGDTMTNEPDKAGKSKERGREMTEGNLSIARKVVLCAGLLAGALLSLYPHWRLSVDLGDERPTVNQDLGRAFISSPPLADPASVTCISISAAVDIHYARQFTEVAIALLLAFGLTRVLRKPAANRKHDAEE